MSDFYKITTLYDFNLFGIASYIITAGAVILIVITVVWIPSVVVTPADPISTINTYESNKLKRSNLRTYLSSINIDPTKINITRLQVATANYGGLMMEQKAPSITGYMTPYHGTVKPSAVKTQIDAGARAIIFDIWPDPKNKEPVVAAMIDNTGYGRNIYAFWKDNFGLKTGNGRYSNWALLTRNTAPVKEIINKVVAEAFVGNQSDDPFFIILNLHGNLTSQYLNTLGGIINTSLAGRKYTPTVTTNSNATLALNNLCSIKVSEMFGKVFVIVNPDLVEDINSFNTRFIKTAMNEVTNLMTSTYPTVVKPSELLLLTKSDYTDCNGTSKVPLYRVSLCTIQPSTGETITDNDSQYPLQSYTQAMNAGVQFVGVNVFTSDKILNDWVTRFGKYSFIYKP